MLFLILPLEVSESIKLEKGKWYSVETGEGLTMSLVNVRIE